MKTLAYSVLFIVMFYIVAIGGQISGLSEGKIGIYMLIGVMAVLGLYIVRRNGK